jgi:glycerol-3-phosphate acyltransferase PlsY
MRDRKVPVLGIPLSLGLLILITVIYLIIDFARLRIHRVKDVFIVLFGSLLRRHEFAGLTGGSYLLLASLVVAALYAPRVLIPAVSFLALGDTIAAIVGLSIGRVKFWGKTLEGTVAGLLVCIGVAVLASMLPDADMRMPLGAGLVGALSASVVEVLPIEVNDNVAVPIVSGLIMHFALLSKLFGS